MSLKMGRRGNTQMHTRFVTTRTGRAFRDNSCAVNVPRRVSWLTVAQPETGANPRSINAVATFAAHVISEILRGFRGQTTSRFDRAPAYVGGDDEARGVRSARVGQWVVRRGRLDGENVERGAAEVAGRERVDERGLVDEGPAAGVDENGAGL